MACYVDYYYNFIFGNHSNNLLLLLFVFPVFVTFFPDDSLLLVAGEDAYVNVMIFNDMYLM